MTAAEAIRARLLAISAVTALVGQRIYTFELPQGSPMPAMVVRFIGDVQDMHLRGAIGNVGARVQIDAVAKKASNYDHYAAARNIDEAMAQPGDGSRLIGWRGTIAGTPPFVVQGVMPGPKREGYDPAELQYFRIIRDVFVYHEV